MEAHEAGSGVGGVEAPGDWRGPRCYHFLMIAIVSHEYRLHMYQTFSFLLITVY